MLCRGRPICWMSITSQRLVQKLTLLVVTYDGLVFPLWIELQSTYPGMSPFYNNGGDE